MSTKGWVTILVIVGSLVGGYIPTFFGKDIFSFWGILTSGIGGIVGILIGLKLGE